MTILETLTVADFKQKTNSTTLKVVENPATGKNFVSNGSETLAAVSKNYKVDNPNKEFIKCKFDDTGEEIWVLHNMANVVEEL